MHLRHRHRLVLVTGGNGFLGQRLAGLLDDRGAEWVAPDSVALDVRDRDRVREAVEDWRADVVVHLAYRRNDPATIVDGSANVAAAAAHAGARLVHLSTDLVFGGRETPYAEGDASDATIDYGRWKAEAERAVADRCPTAVLVRTSLLYGTDRLAPWQLEVRDRRPIEWYEGEVRSATHVDDVAEAIVELFGKPEVAGPLHVAGPDALSRADLARATAAFLGLEAGAVRTSPGASPDRPGRVVLDSSRAAGLGIQCRPLAVALR